MFDVRVAMLFGLLLSVVAMVRLFRKVCGREISAERFIENATVEQYLAMQFYALSLIVFTAMYFTAGYAPR